MVDRALRGEHGVLSGAVVDYLSVSWFAIFNLADVFTVGGIAAAVVAATVQNRRAQGVAAATVHDTVTGA